MNNKQRQPFPSVPHTISTRTATRLLRTAARAARNAHAPYSNFSVGAALLTHDNRTFIGCNVENASLGLTICAERAAILAAITAGYRSFVAIAVTTTNSTAVPYPCGACRQVLAEFCGPDTIVIVAIHSKPEHFTMIPLGKLIPLSFTMSQTPQTPKNKNPKGMPNA